MSAFSGTSAAGFTGGNHVGWLPFRDTAIVVLDGVNQGSLPMYGSLTREASGSYSGTIQIDGNKLLQVYGPLADLNYTVIEGSPLGAKGTLVFTEYRDGQNRIVFP